MEYHDGEWRFMSPWIVVWAKTLQIGKEKDKITIQIYSSENKVLPFS